MNQDILKMMTKARATLILEQPFFGTLALRLRLVEDPRCKTCAVDGVHIFYNPEWVKDLSVPQLRGLLAHEVGHCIFEHIGRRAQRNPQKWNHAGDYVINNMLTEVGFELPPHGLTNPAYKGMSADQVYNLLPENPGNGAGNGEPGGAFDDVLDGDSAGTEAEHSQMKSDWQIATIQAAAAAKAEGKLPAQLERFVDEMTESKADWRAQLRRFVTERSNDDYNWLRPNRRLISQGIYMPSLYNEAMGEIVVAIDTSGSIDQATLNAFGSEINAIRDAVRPKLTRVIYCDAAVNHVDEFQAEDELHFKMHGGGGTDFRPPFKRVADLGAQPACFVYLTDGYGPFPDHAADYPTIWCMTTDVKAPWGENIRIEV